MYFVVNISYICFMQNDDKFLRENNDNYVFMYSSAN